MNIGQQQKWNYPKHNKGLGLYVHFPFCKYKCYYCDFNTYAGIEDLQTPYIKALNSEIRTWGRLLNSPNLHSVFLGGGTPSYIDPMSVKEVMQCINTHFNYSNNMEITIESNPDDLTDTSIFKIWQDAGINRISIGIQSFDDKLLSMLGRRHTAQSAKDAYRIANKHFNKINLDLIYGLPYQTFNNWKATLNQALDLNPTHISVYGLQIETNTPLYSKLLQGEIQQPSDDVAADMYEYTCNALNTAGFEHYEISNWTKSKNYSIHNLGYWQGLPYIGTGAGSHSFLSGMRFANCYSPKKYIKKNLSLSHVVPNSEEPVSFMAKYGSVETIEVIDTKTAMFETIMLNLRHRTGISDYMFKERFGMSIQDVYGQALAYTTQLGLTQWNGSKASLTQKGKILSNEVFIELYKSNQN